MRERMRLWLIGLLDALPLSIVNAEVAIWQADSQKQRSLIEGLEVIVSATAQQLEDSRTKLESVKANLEERTRELKIAQQEKQQFSDVLDARTAEIATWKAKSEQGCLRVEPIDGHR